MHSTSSAIADVVVLLLFIIINAIGRERFPKRIQSALEKTGRKLIRWRRENPIVSLGFIPTPGEKERRDAILDWLDRTEASLRNGG